MCECTINTLGTAITWTGLPVYAYKMTNSYYFAGVLYFTGTLAGIPSTLASGYFIDKFSKKQLSLFSLLVNFILTAILFVGLSVNMFWMISPIMILSQSLGSLTTLCFNVWYNTEANINQLINEISRRNVWTMTSKTIGFTMGPILFMSVSKSWLIYLLGYIMITLGNPLLTNLLKTTIFLNSPTEMKAKVESVMTVFSQIGVLLLMSASMYLVGHWGGKLVLCILSMIALVRIVTFFIKPKVQNVFVE